MLLQHKKNGDWVEFTLRPFQSEDASQLIFCIRDAYGDSYVKTKLYDPATVVQINQAKEMVFSVAVAPDNTVAGITACESSPHFPSQGEISCQVIRQQYNGYGLALPLALHAMEQGEQLPLTSQFARALGCHLISQKTLKGMGFTATGFLLHVYDKEKFHFRFPNGDYEKIPQSVAVKAQSKKHAGHIFLPEELVPLAETMYRELGVTWHPLQTNSPADGCGTWDRSDDTLHATLTLWARNCGTDFESHLSKEMSCVAQRPNQTINLYLNLSSPGCSTAYQTARKLGFFFTGFFPCGADGEYMILHHPLQVPVHVDNIPHIPDYAPFMEQIRRQL